jgi:hypothetical protein
MWWWRRVRKADIPKADRDLFERFGEHVIASVLTGGFNPRSEALRSLYSDEGRIPHAEDWLTERGDAAARHEQRVETVEWAILIFVVLGVLADLGLLFHERGVLH